MYHKSCNGEEQSRSIVKWYLGVPVEGSCLVCAPSISIVLTDMSRCARNDNNLKPLCKLGDDLTLLASSGEKCRKLSREWRAMVFFLLCQDGE